MSSYSFKFIDLPTAAERLGTTRNELLKWVDEGRIKPFDTVARNMLRYLSNYQTFTETPESKTRQPAIKWLLDSIAVPERAIKYPVFRIENIDSPKFNTDDVKDSLFVIDWNKYENNA